MASTQRTVPSPDRSIPCHVCDHADVTQPDRQCRITYIACVRVTTVAVEKR